MAKKPTPLELSITRAIDRHYRKDRGLRVSTIRQALRDVDRTLLVMLTTPKKKRADRRKSRKSKRAKLGSRTPRQMSAF